MVAVVLRKSLADEDDGIGGGGLEGGVDCFEFDSKDEKYGGEAAVGSGVNLVTRSRT